MSHPSRWNRRGFPVAAALLAVSAALFAAGCGPRQPAAGLIPDRTGAAASGRLGSSPLANSSVVLLPFERAPEMGALKENVLQALAEQHRRSLRDTGAAGKVYASLTEAEKAEPKGSFLMLRGTVVAYNPTWREGMGDWVAVFLEARVKYDVWNPKVAGGGPDKGLAMWLEAEPGEARADFEVAGGKPDEAMIRGKLAELLQSAFEKFNQELVSNQKVSQLAPTSR